jgi:hypothetical protein
MINDAGSALLITTLVLYFTREVGLSGPQVGFGLTLGGAIGLLVGVPLGHLADLRGARGVTIALLLLQGLSTLSYVFVSSFTAFVIAACFVVALGRGSAAVQQGLIVRTLAEGDRVTGRMYLSAVSNVGFGVGSALASIGIAIGTKTGYQALIAADAVSYAVAALLVTRLPRAAAAPRAHPDGPRFVVLRDRPYLVVIALSAVLSLQVSLLDVGFPLWVSQHTEAPSWVIGAVFVLNCTMVALLSVRISRGKETPTAASHAARWAGATAAAACVLLAVTGGLSPTAAAVLIGAMAIQAIAEMGHSSFHWGIAFGLAPGNSQGQYQGAAATGFAFALTIGPLLVTSLLQLGGAGFLIFGTMMVAAGAAAVPVTRWAVGTRVA